MLDDCLFLLLINKNIKIAATTTITKKATIIPITHIGKPDPPEDTIAPLFDVVVPEETEGDDAEFEFVPPETGAGVGKGVGAGVGEGVGEGVGAGVGEGVGAGVGEGVGAGVGEGVGEGVGDGVGEGVGDGVGDGVGEGVGE